jgi:hypothetical protein
MLKVGIEGDEVTGPSLQGERNASLQGSALAELIGLAHKRSASSFCDHRCCIRGAIINDNDIWTEPSQPRQNDPNRGRQHVF